jgi:hypothetical protein
VNPGSLHRSLPSAVAGPAVRDPAAAEGRAAGGTAAPGRAEPLGPSGGGTVVVVLSDIHAASRLWGYGRFVFGRSALRRQPGVRFAKILGSGFDGGFGLKPSASRQGLLCLFEDASQASDFLHASPLVQAYRDHAREYLEVRLRPFSCRGSWDGVHFEPGVAPPTHGPIAGLTRASIRPSLARQFWSKAPPAERSLADAQGCLLAAGLGEAPLLRQATFTVWDSLGSMDGYARTGAHMDAIRASREGNFFSESMFVRFVPEGLRGTWKGRTYA